MAAESTAKPAPKRGPEPAPKPGIGAWSLQLRRASVQRGGRPLWRGLDLRLAPGTLTQALGPNGSGKTTLLSVLAGLTPLASGTLECSGASLQGLRTRLVWLGHREALHPLLTLEENLRLAPDGEALPPEGVARALELAQLPHPPSTPVRLLSSGQRRRLALARARCAPAPGLVLLDEPLSGLDPEAAALWSQRLLQWRDAAGQGGAAPAPPPALVVATHAPIEGADATLDLGTLAA